MGHDIRTYGGWRRRRGIGLLGLDTTSTFLALGAAMVLVLVAAAAPWLLIYLLPPALIGGGLGLIRVEGVPLALLLLARCRWRWAVLRGHNRYRAGVVIDHPRAFQLPGVLAPLTLLSAEDGYGGRYGIVWDRRTGLLTATLRVVPASTWLADRADADTWVAAWGGWLAALGHMPAVRWVTVTIDTAPEPGSTLVDTVDKAIDPAAPEAARTIMSELVRTAPAAAADVDTRVSVTFDPRASAASPRDLFEAVADLGRTLDGLASRLGGCGVSVLGRATAAETAGAVRTAFDPHARGEINRILAGSGADEVLTWCDAGPVAAIEHTGHYEHDGGVSVSWAWHEPPRQNVRSDILARLVAPGPFPKRVTLQYRALPAAAASRVLQQEVNAAAFRAQFRRRTGRDETARDSWDSARARQAAAEEAMGAGVCLVSMYATVTVTDPEQLRRAVAHVDASAEAAKIRLRRLWGSQAAGFATTLPCGICPSELSRRLLH
ncbi:SCO6880 family protein [Actinomadura nitritigenes]|uniref:SCO6880 family protein n=1 Tax=Actinomadura nitritigenes TaxID=134602 RepID=UPI0027DE2D87|nr:SCO6880 family protein [Actinomadura nitritigenes]